MIIVPVGTHSDLICQLPALFPVSRSAGSVRHVAADRGLDCTHAAARVGLTARPCRHSHVSVTVLHMTRLNGYLRPVASLRACQPSLAARRDTPRPARLQFFSTPTRRITSRTLRFTAGKPPRLGSDHALAVAHSLCVRAHLCRAARQPPALARARPLPRRAAERSPCRPRLRKF